MGIRAAKKESRRAASSTALQWLTRRGRNALQGLEWNGRVGGPSTPPTDSLCESVGCAQDDSFYRVVGQGGRAALGLPSRDSRGGCLHMIRVARILGYGFRLVVRTEVERTPVGTCLM